MGTKRKKKSRNTETPLPEIDSPRSSTNAGRWVAVALLVLGAGVFLYALTAEGPSTDSRGGASPSASASQSVSTARRDPGQTRSYRYFENPEAAHPLPVTLPPSRFKNTGIAHTYEIAKEIPEILAQQPCLCGCDHTSDDHRSLLDCYADEHASGCMICMKEAVFTKQMTEAGKSANWIRDAILRHEFSDANIGN